MPVVGYNGAAEMIELLADYQLYYPFIPERDSNETATRQQNETIFYYRHRGGRHRIGFHLE